MIRDFYSIYYINLGRGTDIKMDKFCIGICETLEEAKKRLIERVHSFLTFNNSLTVYSVWEPDNEIQDKFIFVIEENEHSITVGKLSGERVAIFYIA